MREYEQSPSSLLDLRQVATRLWILQEKADTLCASDDRTVLLQGLHASLRILDSITRLALAYQRLAHQDGAAVPREQVVELILYILNAITELAADQRVPRAEIATVINARLRTIASASTLAPPP